MLVHCSSVGEVVTHASHKLAEAGVCGSLVIKNNKQRSNQVTHPLHVARVQVLPHISDRRNTYVKRRATPTLLH